MTDVDTAVHNAAALLEESSLEANPDMARLRIEQADTWLRLAELLTERERL